MILFGRALPRRGHFLLSTAVFLALSKLREFPTAGNFYLFLDTFPGNAAPPLAGKDFVDTWFLAPFLSGRYRWFVASFFFKGALCLPPFRRDVTTESPENASLAS